MGNVSALAFSSAPPCTYTEYDVKFADHVKHKLPYLCYPKEPEFPEYSSIAFLVSHGNGEDLGEFAETLKILAFELNGRLENKVYVYGYEYPGYGIRKNEAPSAEGASSSARSMLSHLYNFGFSPERIVLMGRSIGSGPSCELASTMTHMPLGVILVSPFRSAMSVVSTAAAGWLSVMDFYKNEKAVELFDAPTLIIHGDDDNLIDVSHSKILAAKCRNLWKLKIIEGADHVDSRLIDTKTICAFLEKLISKR